MSGSVAATDIVDTRLQRLARAPGICHVLRVAGNLFTLRSTVAVTVLLLSSPRYAAALTAADVDAAAPAATRHVAAVTRVLAANRLKGRDNNTAESQLAQGVLLERLKRFSTGLDAGAGSDDAYRQPFVLLEQTGSNLLAYIPGRELPNEYVLVGAHYDHLGTRSSPNGACFSRGTPGGQVCNGATDNAAGVAVVLGVAEAIRALAMPPRRSVVLALWDSEEDGLLGSRYYVNHPLVPLAQTVAYVNFDILGEDLLPSLRTTSFAVGSETGGAGLQNIIDRSSAAESLNVYKVSYIFGQDRSDYKNFVDHKIPTVFFSDATGGCYHTTGDDLSIVNFAKLRAQAKIAFRVVVELAEAADRLPFSPKNPAGASFTDGLSLNQVFSAAQVDLGLFNPTDRAALHAASMRVAQIVSDGAALFDTEDAFTLLGDASQAIAILAGSGCRRF